MGKIEVISGSPSKSSRLNGVINFILSNLPSDVDLIDIVDLPAEDLLHAKFDSPAIKNANKLIEDAQGIIIATPIYKASYTGILKAFLDLIPQKGLEDKAVLPIVMGGTTAHLLMIEYALKPVLSVLGATTIEKGVFIQDTKVACGEQGKVDQEDELKERLIESLKKFQSIISKKVAV